MSRVIRRARPAPLRPRTFEAAQASGNPRQAAAKTRGGSPREAPRYSSARNASLLFHTCRSPHAEQTKLLPFRSATGNSSASTSMPVGRAGQSVGSGS